MLTTLNREKDIEFGRKYIKLYYGCRNGARHDYSCCPACWNHHPNKKLRLGTMSTTEAMGVFNDIYKKYKRN